MYKGYIYGCDVWHVRRHKGYRYTDVYIGVHKGCRCTVIYRIYIFHCDIWDISTDYGCDIWDTYGI